MKKGNNAARTICELASASLVLHCGEIAARPEMPSLIGIEPGDCRGNSAERENALHRMKPK